ncbi:non-ribosomal peptide synthetase [Actinoalloteichus fjordicus]|uniref:Amino acid adenylation enzyme/thioester reductase family protein n=1 Tax=Actinoalloteichus fjordicus TaxID=1612552 RepID=A0AAC9PSH6_9PSEU|nr:non-ribosomal peptide synthetase [Actinoalloteichus fjordicus]APU15020.1 amino acid adenylation enzyme/thioester reductase family protein [Actinoalloteichus fjordicus]
MTLRVRDLFADDADETTAQVAEWNDTARDRPTDVGVHHLVRRQAAEHGARPAVTFDGSTVTYAQLDAAAAALAGRLIGLGVRPGDVVAVAMPPSADRITAVLGVLYAGAAYLPLDPELPARRLEFLLADADASALITDTAARAGQLRHDGPVLSFDAPSPDPEPTGATTTEQAAFPGADLVAYVIYTSGSTGRPKGVAVNHRSLVNRLLWMRDRYQVGPEDVILHKTSFSFDVSVWEQLLPLISGARLVVTPEATRRDSGALVTLIRDESVTMLHFVPSLLPAFLDVAGVVQAATLRVAISSGEALPKPMAAEFARTLPHCALHNLYGPTEATIDVTHWAVDAADERPFVPIGTPIDNTSVHVLDDDLTPLPVGSEGELCIGGRAVAVGYLGRGSLTAERFVPDPFGDPGDRLYRTGDRARFGPDGAVEYLGRRDGQVKLRGYRIELGEIESALLESDLVGQAAVVLRGVDGARRLVGFVSGRPETAAEREQAAAQVLATVAAALPAYQVPAELVWLDTLPLTTSGKIDRAALPEVTVQRSAAAPETPTEQAIASLWAELIGAGEPGLDDDFFRSGGDSVSSMRLAARAQREGIRLEVATIFTDRTVRGMAASADRAASTPAVESPSDAAGADALTAGIDEAQLASVRDRPGVVDVYPLAPMQAGMLFRGLYWPDSDAYFNQNVLELVGGVDEAALHEAWRRVADRYEILRTGFVWEELAEPLQYVRSDVQPPWTTLDWSQESPDRHAELLERLLADDRAAGLGLDACPLYRLTLVRRGDQGHYLLWSHHHILLDGWCLSLIWGDMFRIYEDLVQGREPQLSPCRPYRDYVGWIRAKTAQGDEPERFWREYLAELSPTPFSEAPSDREGLFHTIVHEFTESLTELVAEASRRYGVTSNAITQAAWSMLLALRSGAEDVVHGLTIAGRPPELAGSELMVGLFINTIPLRIRLDPDRTVTELLDAIHRDLAITSAQGHVPLAQIKSWAGGTRLSGGRVFDSLVAFENYPEDNLPGDDELSIQVIDLHAQEKTEYPIGLIVLPLEKLAFHFNYDTTHFTAAEVDRLIATFQLLMEQLCTRPSARLRELDVTPAADRELLADWNSTTTDEPDAATLLALFTRSLAAAPHAPAVVEGDTVVSYTDLNARAAALAGRLAEAGVARGDLVALCLPRSTAFVTALLAVHRHGAVPVLLDPDHPTARQHTIAADAGVAAVLTSGDPAGFAAWPVIHPDGTVTAPTGPPSRTRGVADPDRDACLVYTSGSTGTPKGVLAPQAGLVNRIVWSGTAFPTEQPPRVSATAGTAFDIALWEVFFPLAHGGTVVIVPHEVVLDADRLAELLRAEKVSVAHLLPTLLAAFLDGPEAAHCTGLRHVLSGGEAVSPALVRAFAYSGLDALLHQAYGPAEASISVTHHTCTPEDGLGDRVPIGRPIDNTTVHVVDAHLREVPVGCVGELATAGIAVGAGYLGDADLTARRFPANPFGEGRLYLTGDRARWRTDGTLEFLGRDDRQVKVRGHRVEPAEIDRTAEEHPTVRHAVTVVHDGALTTFAVPRAGAALDPGALRRLLVERLPDWMIGGITVLDALPVTGNGKVDQRRLTELAGAADAQAGAEASRPPTTELEQLIARCWEEVLGVSGIGAHDDFFDLGGHSLLVVRLLRVLRENLPAGMRCDVPQILKAGTVAGLAEQLLGPVAGSGSQHVHTLNPDATGGALFLVHPGEGLALPYHGLAPLLPEWRLHVLSDPRFGQPDHRFGTLAEMATRYVEWVRTLEPEGPYHLGGWSFGGVVALEMARQMQAHGDVVTDVLLIDSHNLNATAPTGDPREGIRARLVELGVDADSPEGVDLADELEHNGGLAARYPQPAYPDRVSLLSVDAGDRDAARPHGWDRALFPGLVVTTVPGDHERLFDTDHLPDTAAAVRDALGENR